MTSPGGRSGAERGHTEEDTAHERVGVVALLVGLFDVAEGQHIELFQTSATGDVDREQDRPCDEAAEKTDGDADLQVSKEEESIQGVMVQHIAIRDLEEHLEPGHETGRKFGRAFPTALTRHGISEPWATVMASCQPTRCARCLSSFGANTVVADCVGGSRRARRMPWRGAAPARAWTPDPTANWIPASDWHRWPVQRGYDGAHERQPRWRPSPLHELKMSQRVSRGIE